jgi:glucose-1-phosphate adenylyltransferase
MISRGEKISAFPYTGYWVDIGTVNSYWQAHMDLLNETPSIDLDDRSWVLHTRTEERPPVRIARGAEICDSMITDGCIIAPGAKVDRSILSPGVRVMPGAQVFESIVLTDTVIECGAVVEHAIIDKRVHIGENSHVGAAGDSSNPSITLIGKNSQIPPRITIEPGAVIGTDIIFSDFTSDLVRSDEYIQTKWSEVQSRWGAP